MEVGKFALSGKTAFFKKPDVNSYLYFTYGNIHKIALLGMFGAILGYGGYNQMKTGKSLEKSGCKGKDEQRYPEFYEKLRELPISVIPKHRKGFIPKKVQTFNNSVGYASQEKGGNLIVKEQWLENPLWEIYLLLDSKESEMILDALQNHKVIYQPYLGKNDHIATIKDIQILKANEYDCSTGRIDSLFPKKETQIVIEEEEEEDDDEYIEDFKYEEYLPVALDETTNRYILEPFIFTNMNVQLNKGLKVFRVEDKNIIFY